jgi:hypothetical protein
MPRVENNTPNALNQRVHKRTVESLRQALDGGPRAIEQRLEELDGEWDIERALQVGAASLVLTGIGLSLTTDRRWLGLSGVVAGFLIQHAVQGWCPPLPLFRALGFRTMREIEHERNALKGARGDFEALDVAKAAGPNTLLAVAEL